MEKGRDAGALQVIETRLCRPGVPEAWEELLWEGYRRSFDGLDTFVDQMYYDQETFIAALRDPTYLKFVLCEEEQPLGLALATNDMDRARVAYINQDYLRRHYPEEVEGGRFYYITAIYIDPSCQGLGYAKSLLRAMLSYMKEGRRIAGFDFCEAKAYLSDVIENLGRDPEVGIPVISRRVDAQVYHILQLEEYQEQKP